MEAEGARLLVVDDDPEIRELTQAYLSRQGFEVDCVDGGTAMDAYLDGLRPDLIVLDLMLPGEHGLSIARRLKGERDIPIIIVSAQGEDVDRIVGLEVGRRRLPRQAFQSKRASGPHSGGAAPHRPAPGRRC